LVDWGAVADHDDLERRTAAALARGGGRGPGVGTHLPPDEVDEMRLFAAYLASHPDTPQLVLDPAPSAAELTEFARPAQFVRDIAVETASVEAGSS
jgi:hypothetical protein